MLISPLNATLIGLLLLAGLIGAYSWFGYRKITKDARQDWEYRVRENMQDLRLRKQDYINAYIKTGAPRASKYLAVIIASIAVLIIPAFALIELFLHYVWIWSGKSRVFEPPFLVWQYSSFFLFLGILASIVWVFVRAYHRRSPGLMRDALIDARNEYWPEQKVKIGPNPIQLKAEDYGKNGFGKLNTLFEDALGFHRQTDNNYNNSGHICEIYSLEDAKICVHVNAAGKDFSAKSHPFFFPGEFARHDDKPRHGEIIILLPQADAAYQKIIASGLCENKYRAGVRRNTYHVKLPYLGIYIYNAN